VSPDPQLVQNFAAGFALLLLLLLLLVLLPLLFTALRAGAPLGGGGLFCWLPFRGEEGEAVEGGGGGGLLFLLLVLLLRLLLLERGDDVVAAAGGGDGSKYSVVAGTEGEVLSFDLDLDLEFFPPIKKS